MKKLVMLTAAAAACAWLAGCAVVKGRAGESSYYGWAFGDKASTTLAGLNITETQGPDGTLERGVGVDKAGSVSETKLMETIGKVLVTGIAAYTMTPGLAGGGGGNNVSTPSGGGNIGGGNVNVGPAQLALPAGDAVWIMGGPACSRCSTLRRSLGGVTEIGGLPIRWAVMGQSAYFDALREVAFACQVGTTIRFPFVIVVRGDGGPVCVGTLDALTAEGLESMING